MRILASTLVASLLVATGCQQPTMEQMMQKPERAAQLDQLQPLVGKWESSGTMKMGDEQMSMTGRSEVAWELDRRVLVERMEGHSEAGDFKGLGVWVWDDASDQFRVWWFDNMGGWAEGTVEQDDEDGEWEFKAKSHYPGGGMTGHARGSMTLSGDTMNWTHAEFMDALCMNKMMSMEGTSRRVK